MAQIKSQIMIDQFQYQLPPELIAQTPAVPRDSSKLLVVNRTDDTLSHHLFRDLPDLLQVSDVLVRNNTKVIPARLFGQKETGGKCELLLVKAVRHDIQTVTWECLTKPGLKVGQVVHFANSDVTATCTTINEFTRLIEFSASPAQFFVALDAIGHTPIPPYISWAKDDELELRQVYQTTFAKFAGSVAAPTAGLHFTPELDEMLRQKGVEIFEVTLHVGLGTFLPVQDSQLQSGKLHQEFFELKKEVAEKLNQAKAVGRRIISVGTTTTRVLESCADEHGILSARTGETDLFIWPGYRFRCVDALITNFHLPKSSLLMLISAFVSEPNTKTTFADFQHSLVGRAYQTAIEHHYRFFSFGDAMLIQ